MVDVQVSRNFLGTLPGSINIPVDELREDFRRFQLMMYWSTAKSDNVPYCSVVIERDGFNALNLDGGYQT